jgi:hypothetical protein
MITLLKEKRCGSGLLNYSACKPFVQNSHGVLVHRPIALCLHKLQGKHHLGVHYACGNQATGSSKFTFLDSVDASMVICQKCEENAVKLGYATSDAICGKHVHVGGTKAVVTCCNFENQPSPMGAERTRV